MKTDKTKLLLEYLNNHNDYVKSSDLSIYLSVTARQIRKYVSSVNEKYPGLICSNPQGYLLDKTIYQQISLHNTEMDYSQNRQKYILQRLIAHLDGYSIFDLADELFISVPTIEKDLIQLKTTISKYRLDIKRKKEFVHIIGEERDIRRFINQLLSDESYHILTLNQNMDFFSFSYDFYEIQSIMKKIFQEEGISENDFALYNTAIHLIIILDRLSHQCYLQNISVPENLLSTRQYQAALKIKGYFEEQYGVNVTAPELYNIMLIITNHANQVYVPDYSSLNIDTLQQYIDKQYVQITRHLLHDAERHYYLPPFSEEFVSKLSLHIQNLFHRLHNNYYAKNPLTTKIRVAYPLIYEIAIFIAQNLKQYYQLDLNEDEIAFIAFHVGAYFEENSLKKNYLNCAFIYADYYAYYQNTLEKIMQKYDDKIILKVQSPFMEFEPEEFSDLDLIISLVDIPFNCPTVHLSIFMKEHDWEQLDMAIRKAIHRKKKWILKSYIMNFFHQELFYKNPEIQDKYSILKTMCQDLTRSDYTVSGYYEDLCAREAISSTAYNDVAMPHALTNNNTNKSFISIALFDDGIYWNDTLVHIVAVIGIHANSYSVFAEFFDEIIDIFSSHVNNQKILAAKDFNDFIRIIQELLS